MVGQDGKSLSDEELPAEYYGAIRAIPSIVDADAEARRSTPARADNGQSDHDGADMMRE